MRKTEITVKIICNLENEQTILDWIVDQLRKQKENGVIEKATFQSREIEVPIELEI